MTGPDPSPWWASGNDRVGAEDPLSAHRSARAGGNGSGDPQEGEASADRIAEGIDLAVRLLTQAGRRLSERIAEPPQGSTAPPAEDGAGSEASRGPHADGSVCDACPVCIGLRAIRQVRPEVIAHLSDAAHNISLALRAVAEAQAGETDIGFTPIDLDP